MAQSINSPKQRPRKQKPSLIGHNLHLTEEERKGLFLSHLDALRQGDDAVAKAVEDAKPSLALVKAARALRKKARDAVLVDGFSLERLDRQLRDMRKTTKEARVEAEAERKERTWAGLPLGDQLELDLTNWRAEGRRDGLMGRTPTPPASVPPGGSSQDWLEGWHAGQDELGQAFIERARVQERRWAMNDNDVTRMDVPAAANDNHPVIVSVGG